MATSAGMTLALEAVAGAAQVKRVVDREPGRGTARAGLWVRHRCRESTTFMLVLSLFTLGNSTDASLLLKLTDVAGSPKWIPLMWRRCTS